jgi:hypothetical protein
MAQVCQGDISCSRGRFIRILNGQVNFYFGMWATVLIFALPFKGRIAR